MNISEGPKSFSASNFSEEDENLIPSRINTIPDEEVFRIPDKCYLAPPGSSLPLSEIKQRLEKAYCGSIGVEFMHITSQEQKDWIRRKFETPQEYSSPDEQRLTLERVIR